MGHAERGEGSGTESEGKCAHSQGTLPRLHSVVMTVQFLHEYLAGELRRFGFLPL